MAPVYIGFLRHTSDTFTDQWDSGNFSETKQTVTYSKCNVNLPHLLLELKI